MPSRTTPATAICYPRGTSLSLPPTQVSTPIERLSAIAGDETEPYEHIKIPVPQPADITLGFEPTNLPKIRVYPPPRSTKKICPDPVLKVNQDQIVMLDPTGVRARLFSEDNPDRVRPGDILHVRIKNENPVSGVCLSIRQRHHPVDSSILLRNQLTRIGVEMWIKIYSPNVEGIEIVQRKEKRARRARLYYMRLPKHDVGSVENTVRAYLRQKAGPISSSSVKARDANADKKKNNKKGRN
jgi:ribosomal protein L19